MFKYLLIALLGLTLVASAQSLITPEERFFGIPNADSLCSPWFLTMTDTTSAGFAHPVDIDVLKLSAFDYRIVILDAYPRFFTSLRMNQTSGVPSGGVICSGEAPDTTDNDATAMCLIQHGLWFNPQTDRIAVTFWKGGKVGIYQFDSGTGQLFLKRSFTSSAITKPIGIYWAFDNFFIVDEATQCIFRTDTLGNVISHYGRWGLHVDGYQWISDMSAYVDGSNTAHLYVCDGINLRVDHLTSAASGSAINLYSQVWAQPQDTGNYNTHEVAFIPNVGVLGLDRFEQRFYFWNRTDSLQAATRSHQYWGRMLSPVIHLWQTCGRLVIAYTQQNGGWTLRSYQVTGATLDNPIPYPTDHWTIGISPVVISNPWHVTSGTNLIIDPGVQVRFEHGAGLVVDGGGRLTVNGTALNPVIFATASVTETWTGIKVDNGGALNMTYSNVSDADSFCVFADTPEDTTNFPLHIDHCYFDGSKLVTGADALRIWGKPGYTMSVTNSRIDHVTNGRGLYLYNCTADFFSDTIQGCDTSNTYLKQVSGKFRSCVFQGRSKGHAVLFEGSDCTPNFQCCLFKDLASLDGAVVPLLALKGTGPTFGWEDNSNSGVSNAISDSAASLLHFYDDKVMPIIDNVNPNGGPGGRNDWYQHKSSGKYLYWENGTTNPRYSAENQYWNNGVNDALFYPSPALGYFALDTVPKDPWGLCGSGQGLMVHHGSNRGVGGRVQGLDDLASDLELFSEAMTAELSENYGDAQVSFRNVVAATTDEELRWQSLTHIVSTQRHLNGETGDGWIPSLIDSAISVDSNAYGTHLYGHRLLAGYRTDREQFSDAITICTDLLNSQLTYDDSLMVAIDLVGIQMLADSGNGGGGLDNPRHPNIPAGLRVYSVAQGLTLEGELLRLLGTSGHSTQRYPAIPTRYVLYQNYPNPFNPTTEIRFDLPEAVHVELKIFNTLGQLVTTLLNESRPSGAYRVAWNGSGFASGLYVYQLRAGNFTDSKKMLLLK